MMQLATSSRPHPPPVPPRPSRQVVAEALKRSTRLPCPTRQAPPPPNTRPWRSEDHVSGARECRDGRTLVYESATLGKESPSNCEDSVRSASEPREETRREPKSPRRSGSYGYVERDSRGENSVVEDCKPVERFEAPNYQNTLGRESPEKKLPMSRTNGKVPDDRDRDGESPITTTKNTGVSTKEETDYRRSKDDASLDGHVIESVLEHREKPEDKPRTKVAKENRSALAKNSDSHKTSPLTSGTSTTPARITSTLNVTNDENSQPPNTTDDTSLGAEGNKDGDKTYNGTGTTTISSDDCTTVVVIDEPQRKISFNEDNIQHQDWLEAGVRYSSTKITLPYGEETHERTDEQLNLDGRQGHHEDYNHRDPEDRNDLPVYSERDFASIRERIAMSSLQGLPPLPRSLSGFNLNEGRREACEPPPPPTRSSSKTPKNVKSTQPSSSRPSPPGRQLTTLDTQLAILRKEMFGLRQLDLSLLSQLWSLNESIQEFRQLLQEQEDRAPSPSPSSEEGDDTSYGSHPPPPPRRPAPLLHHHRPPRPPRPLRPPASDESPSSEEYGAV